MRDNFATGDACLVGPEVHFLPTWRLAGEAEVRPHLPGGPTHEPKGGQLPTFIQ